MKIVVPVDRDKITIYKRTGKAPFFNIYNDEQLIDTIVNNHSNSNEEDNNSTTQEDIERHKKDIENLKGCDIILAQAVGANMGKALESIGLEVQKISKIDGTKAIEVVVRFLAYKLKRQGYIS
ncbi:MAG: hypothetical protein KAJ49_06385 [Arcobacteraceae bacterium]|nr:hypothetical protein [Arcobacteraceae bacterium]